MHQQKIIDSIISRLDTDGFRKVFVTLVCSPKELKKRIEKDVSDGKRTPDAVKRALSYLPLYDELSTVKLDTSNISSMTAAKKTAAL